jgi:hypothetical protein
MLFDFTVMAEQEPTGNNLSMNPNGFQQNASERYFDRIYDLVNKSSQQDQKPGLTLFLEDMRANQSLYDWQMINGSLTVPARTIAFTDLNLDGQTDVVAVRKAVENVQQVAMLDFYLNEEGNFLKIHEEPFSITYDGGYYSIVFLTPDPEARICIYQAANPNWDGYHFTWYSINDQGDMVQLGEVSHIADFDNGGMQFVKENLQSISSEEYFEKLNRLWQSREEVLIYDSGDGRLTTELGNLPEMSAVTLDEAIAQVDALSGIWK